MTREMMIDEAVRWWMAANPGYLSHMSRCSACFDMALPRIRHEFRRIASEQAR